jgi:hypothetical protein
VVSGGEETGFGPLTTHHSPLTTHQITLLLPSGAPSSPGYEDLKEIRPMKSLQTVRLARPKIFMFSLHPASSSF